MTKRAGWKRFARQEQGSTLVEFSITAGLLLMVVFGVIDCARALYTYHFISYAAEQGARYATVRGGDWSSSCSSYTSYDCTASSANIQSYVQSLTPMGITAGSVTANTTWPGTTVSGSTTGCSTATDQGCLVKVQVTYKFYFFLMAYPPQGSLNMSASSEQVIAY